MDSRTHEKCEIMTDEVKGQVLPYSFPRVGPGVSMQVTFYVIPRW